MLPKPLPTLARMPDRATEPSVILTYKVQQNDTLWAIAKLYYGRGEKYTKIVEANKLTSTVLRPGMILVIPQE